MQNTENNILENNTIPTEAVIFIPGLFHEEKGYYFDILREGLENQERLNFKSIGEVSILGHAGQRFGIYSEGNLLKKIDIYEAFWLDIIAEQKLSSKDLRAKFLEGTSLLIYWLFSSIWKSFYEAPSLIMGLIASLFALVFWYYGILITIIKDVAEKGNFFGQTIPKDSQWYEYIKIIVAILDSWTVFILVGIILSFVGAISLDKMIDQAYFAKKYLGNLAGIILRNKICSRVKKITDDILNDYDKVTILAHSFGAIIGTDFLADYRSKKTLKYITLGGNLKLLSYRSKWIKEEIKKCLDNQVISKWDDYYSKQDWLGAETPIPKGSNSAKIERHEFPIQCFFMDRLFGITHIAYLSDPSWAEIWLKDY